MSEGNNFICSVPLSGQHLSDYTSRETYGVLGAIAGKEFVGWSQNVIFPDCWCILDPWAISG